MGMEGSDRRVGGREVGRSGRRREEENLSQTQEEEGRGESDSGGDKRGIIICKSGNPEWPRPPPPPCPSATSLAC